MSRFSVKAEIALSKANIDKSHPQFESLKKEMVALIESQEKEQGVLLESIISDSKGKKSADSARPKNKDLAVGGEKIIKGREEKYETTAKTTTSETKGETVASVNAKAVAAHKKAVASTFKNKDLSKNETRLKSLMESLMADNAYLEHIESLRPVCVSGADIQSLELAKQNFLESHDYFGKQAEILALVETVEAEINEMKALIEAEGETNPDGTPVFEDPLKKLDADAAQANAQAQATIDAATKVQDAVKDASGTNATAGTTAMPNG